LVSIWDYPFDHLDFPWKWWENEYGTNSQGYRYTRMAALHDLMKINPLALIDCKEIQALIDYGPMFQKISTFNAPPSIVSRLDSVRNVAPNFIGEIDNFYLQTLQNADGSVVNCDFFPVRITQLPPGFTAESLLEYFRTHINEFISPSQNKSFHPYKHGSFNDSARFFKPYEQSLGAIVHINMENDGSVIISDYKRNHSTAGHLWHQFTFSTLETPLDFEHPVAGNRQFGIYSNSATPNEFTFYTMAVDRVWDRIFEFGDAINPFINGFQLADNLWKNIQNNLIAYINLHGGAANSFHPASYISRPEWSDVKDYLTGLIDLNTLRLRLGC
jgi:hypothetical protein